MADGPRRPPDELARLGTEAHDRQVRPRLRPEDDHEFVAVDVDTGEFEVDRDDYTAITRLLARRPGADVWLERVGQATACKMRSRRIDGGVADAGRRALIVVTLSR